MHIQIEWDVAEGDEGDQGGGDPASAATTAQAAAGDAPSPFRQGAELAAGKVDVEEVASLQPQRAPDTTTPVNDGAPDDVEGKTEEEIAAAAAAKAGKDPTEQQGAPAGDEEEEEEAAAPVDDKEFQANLAKEVEDLAKEGVKPKALARFKAQAERIRVLETERPELARVAAEAVRWEESISDTGANPEQFGRVMGYLHAINKGTREQKLMARHALTEELKWIDGELGIEGGEYDPLDEFPDLKDKVQKGAIDREDAEELARRRMIDKQGDTAKAQREAQEAQEKETAAVLSGIQAYGAEMSKKDPQFKEKLQYLAPTVELIQKNLPPAKWLGAIKEAIAKLPKLPVAPQPRPRVTAPSVRPGASTDTVPKLTSKNAFGAGVEAARKTGR